MFQNLKTALLSLLTLCCPAFAEPLYSCTGNMPDWTLEIDGDAALFTNPDPLDMTIPQRSTAQGREWPQAFTLIGGRDTAIVIMNERTCSTRTTTNYALEVHVLTQDGEEPVILTGCCTSP